MLDTNEVEEILPQLSWVESLKRVL